MNIIDVTKSKGDLLVQELVSYAETRKLEFKRVSGKMVGKALETVCAFANSEGGVVVLGVADIKEFQGNNRLFGIEENPEAVDDLQRALVTSFDPTIRGIRMERLYCKLYNGPAKGQDGCIILLKVERSPNVHSVINNGGTYIRLDAGNRPLKASEITDLSYRRGDRSATSEVVPVSLTLLETATWKQFLANRGLAAGEFSDQLMRIGLADILAGSVQPRRAAVLLFADEPGGLLSAFDNRADVRIMVYDGKHIGAGALPNLRKPPKTIRGPLINLIDGAVRVVLDELAQGLTLSSSGFMTAHAYPTRVVKEAIVNAIIHRDYRLNRDIFVRIFDDRIEIESPGTLPGNITTASIERAGSRSRNPLLASNLREFPQPPNIDAGEGVRMMFAEMASAELYPPQYRQSIDAEVETLTVTLFNAKRPSAWDVVSDWVDRNGYIANADVVKIANVETLKASKLLTAWRDQGWLIAVPGRGKRNMAYAKPGAELAQRLLSELEDNNI
jgi:ATP-dependent DNA helicase RecG